MSSNIIIQYDDAEKFYKLPDGGQMHALKKLNLSIHEGETFGLLGPNGAGKTTAINLLAGVISLSSGNVTVCGTKVNEDSVETKKLLGVVQQELLVDSFFSLPVMLKLQSKLSGVVPDMEWIHYLLDILQLSTHAKKTTRELSGGMKRRMMIARALVHKPKIIVLDEPTAGVDVHLRHSMWEFMGELRKFGVTIILTTHYLDEAEKFCDRIAIMNHGQVVTMKSNTELLTLGNNPKLVTVVKPNFSIQSLSDLSPTLKSLCQKHNILSEISIEEGQTRLYFKREFDESKLESLQESLQVLRLILNEIDGLVLQSFTEHTKLEDIFLELTA